MPFGNNVLCYKGGAKYVLRITSLFKMAGILWVFCEVTVERSLTQRCITYSLMMLKCKSSVNFN